MKPSWQETPEPPVAEDALDASGNFILSKPLNLSKDQHHCYASTAEIKGHSSSRSVKVETYQLLIGQRMHIFVVLIAP